MNIGILGGGQLSRMLALSGIPLGLDFSFFEPGKENCVSRLGKVVQKPYTDIDAITAFIKDCDVITFENENIPPKTVETIANLKPMHPNALSLQTTQDRLLEKSLFAELGIPTVAYQSIENLEDLKSFIVEHQYPVVLKKRRQGYDGKGQVKLTCEDDLNKLEPSQLSDAIVEQFIQFTREVSMIAVRNTKGELAYYDICENVHKHGILHVTQNKVEDPLFTQAKTLIDKVLQHLDYVGTLAFEFFAVNNKLYANELAPRVHNSGHWTIEGTQTSQFENHLRAILGLSLGNTESLGPYQMLNLLGKIPNYEHLISFDSLHLHDYQKTARSGRKVGHVTLPLTAKTNDYLPELTKLIAL